MSASRRFHFWLPSDLEADLMSYGHPRGLLLGPAIRILARRSLELEGHRPAGVAPNDSPAALAALMAAEHAVLMVASVLPEGQRRMRELSAQAAAAAEERLALFKDAGQ